MRLWHEKLIPLLPRAQLLGQHRECCALRGLSWGKKHAVVDYVFSHPREDLAEYHRRVIAELDRRGYRVETAWRDPAYRGRRCPPCPADPLRLAAARCRAMVYREHDGLYLANCLENLRGKGIELNP